jgi:hypothetical protein
VVIVGETGIVTDELSDALNHDNVPEQPVALSEILLPEEILTFACGVGVVGIGLTVTVIVAVAVQLLALLTVTVYVPEFETVTFKILTDTLVDV